MARVQFLADALGEEHVEQTDAVAAGLPVRRCVKASVNRVASSTSSRMSVIRDSGSRR